MSAPPGARAALAAAFLLAAACSGPGGWNRADLNGAVLTPPIPKPDFTLTDTHGRLYDFRRETHGRIVLLYFGYTHCEDMCPLQMQDVLDLLAGLADDPAD